MSQKNKVLINKNISSLPKNIIYIDWLADRYKTR